MLTLVGRKTDQAVVEKNGLRFSTHDTEYVEKFKGAIEKNYGIAKSDISLFQIYDDSTEMHRIRRGDEYSVVWEEGEIVGVDFSAEDSRNRYTVEVSSSLISVGESVDITIRLYQSDGLTALTNVNTTVRVPVTTPRGSAHVGMRFSSGVAQKNIVLTSPGIYKLGKHHIGNFTLQGDPCVVEVDL